MKTDTQFVGDPFGSTFAHMIILDPARPKNTQPFLPGYSKDKRYPESPDKEYVFEGMLERVWTKYLLNGSTLCIEVWYRPDKRFTWEQAPMILVLEPKEYRIVSHESVTPRMLQALDRHYQAIRNGQQAPAQSKSSQAGIKYERVLDHLLRCKAFPTIDELSAYCVARLTESKAVGMMDDFQRKYQAKWFGGVSENLPPAVKQVLTKPDAHQQIVSKLAGKFNANK